MEGGERASPYSVLELREEVAPETVELARFLESVWF